MAQAAETQERSIEDQRGQLISSEVNNAVHSAINALAQTIVVDNHRTLEELVREMLRPMVKTWLDNNLAPVVERLVCAEIERISPSRRIASPPSH
jgi:cell pole-organizing protein PopZ